MIKNLESPRIVERYEQFLSLSNNKVYELHWRSKVLSYHTCGEGGYDVECLEYLPESLNLRLVHQDGQLGSPLSVEQFNVANPEEQLDFKCNCHGFTFANGKFFVNNVFVSSILEDEYLEVTNKEEIREGNYNLICFKDPLLDEWIHSCKYKYELFIHKEGIRKFSVHRTIDEIISISEYRHSEVHYFRRKESSCPGICLNAVGEPHIKTFGNNSW